MPQLLLPSLCLLKRPSNPREGLMQGPRLVGSSSSSLPFSNLCPPLVSRLWPGLRSPYVCFVRSHPTNQAACRMGLHTKHNIQ
mmetsp:Transcript_14102/g.21288  ORF Transcript_14102/g.21288 Transcript_14102/m.21288 type:complete len:83 (-) Transcript_14102:170-418(-)